MSYCKHIGEIDMKYREEIKAIEKDADVSFKEYCENIRKQLMSSITYSERIIQFEYSGKKLVKIKYQDGTSSAYTYGESGNSYYLTSIRDQTGYRLNYQYGTNKITLQESTNVSKITDNSTITCAEIYGNKLEMTFIGNKTYIKGKDGKRLVHLFDSSGQAYCSYKDSGTTTGGNKINAVNDIEYISSSGDTMFSVTAQKEAKNYVINGSFTNNTYGWSGTNLNSACDYVTTIAAADATGAYRLYGETGKVKFISQNVSVPTGIDSFILYGFAKAKSLPTNIRMIIRDDGYDAETESTKFGLSAQIIYTDGTTEPVSTSSYNFVEEEWQLAAVGICKSAENKNKQIQYVAIRLEYTNNLNSAYFDNVCLVPGKYAKQKVTQNYKVVHTDGVNEITQIQNIYYDEESVSTHENGNCILTEEDVSTMLEKTTEDGKRVVCIGKEIISDATQIYFEIGGKKYNIDDIVLRSTQTIKVEDGTGQTVEMTTDIDGNIVKSVINDADGGSYVQEYTYSKGKQTSQKDVYRGIVSENSYNSNGNLVMAKTRNANDIDATEAIITNYLYNNNGNTLYSENGTRGNGFETITVFSNTYGRLEYTTLPDGTKINYNYYSDNSLQSMTTTVGTEVISNTYNYMQGLLTKLVCNNNEYKFEYDGFGRLTKTYVNGAEFVGSEYYDGSDYSSTDESTYDYTKTTYNVGSGRSYSEKTIYNKDGAAVCLQGSEGNETEELARVTYDEYGRAASVSDKGLWLV